MKYEIYIFEEAKTASFYKKAIAEYEKRLSRYCKISCRFIRKEKEWEKLLDSAAAMAGAGDAQNGGGPCLILPGPDSVSSEGFSEELRRWEMSGQGKKLFFIPGAHFVSPEKEKLPILNLSDFTMNTAMTAMILYEQIYRGYRIMNHHPYHK